MALVSYDASDSSDYEEDSTLDTNHIKDSIPIVPTEVSNKENDSEISLFNQLPLPTTAKKTSIEEDDEFLHKKVTAKTEQKPKSKIAVPSLSDFKDVEDTVPSLKPKVTTGKKSGLLSILPQPRNCIINTSKQLIPNVIQKPHITQKKVSLSATAKKENATSKSHTLVMEYSDESDNDDVQNDFFSINKAVELPEDNLPIHTQNDIQKCSTKTEPRSIESYFKKDDEFIHLQADHDVDYSEENREISEQNGASGSSNDVVLDEEAIMKLCGTRGKRKREEIQIVDVNGQEVLNEARQWLMKGLMDDTTKRQSASKKRGNEPTSQQKRKHQITYLAHQAKANEAELQNQWANNRMTKRNAQSKYGF